MAPAIAYAAEGYPASAQLCLMWQRAARRYLQMDAGGVFEAWKRTFLPGGQAPAFGDIIRLPDHARSLEKISATDAEAFYRGELTERILRDSREFGGFFEAADFEKTLKLMLEEPLQVIL